MRTGDQLTLGERAADRVRNGMGSWPFVITAMFFLGVWMGTDGIGVDPSPWIKLNLLLSCLAAMQGAILLIAAKRADQISSEVAKHTAENTDLLVNLVQADKALTEEVHQALGIDGHGTRNS